MGNLRVTQVLHKMTKVQKIWLSRKRVASRSRGPSGVTRLRRIYRWYFSRSRGPSGKYECDQGPTHSALVTKSCLPIQGSQWGNSTKVHNKIPPDLGPVGENTRRPRSCDADQGPMCSTNAATTLWRPRSKTTDQGPKIVTASQQFGTGGVH